MYIYEHVTNYHKNNHCISHRSDIYYPKSRHEIVRYQVIQFRHVNEYIYVSISIILMVLTYFYIHNKELLDVLDILISSNNLKTLK